MAFATYIDNMCGIVGYVGNKNAIDVVYDGLKALEYRGYDSAGIATSNGKIEIFKTSGRVTDLLKKLPSRPCHTAIGHTRWATHGAPTCANAHPHLSYDGKIAVVHNGIVENYSDLKQRVLAEGITFASDTDSEVIAHLLALCSSSDFLQTVSKVADMIEGATTFLAIREGDDKVYCSRRGASLTIGVGIDENFVTSDTLAVCDKTDKVMPLKDGDVAVISKNEITVFNGGQKIVRGVGQLNRTRPCESDCYMRTEIEEIPSAVSRTIDRFFAEWDSSLTKKIKTADKIFFVGCGTAFHACLYAVRVFKKVLNAPCEAVCSSEFDSSEVTARTVAFFVSQSGETADTVLAANECKRRGGFSVAICNVEGSLLSYTANAVLYTEAGAEVAVAATKSYVCQLTLLFLLSKSVSGEILPQTFKRDFVSSLEKAVALYRLPTIGYAEKLFFIGKGFDVISASEAALKVKEITYKMTDAYPAGELKHGPIALIDKSSLAIVIATEKQDANRIKATIQELKSRGATIYAVSSLSDLSADETILLPAPPDALLYPAVAIIPLERFALDTSLTLGLNPDKPRNLAKSVTVI